jgi:hypothetical protein
MPSPYISSCPSCPPCSDGHRCAVYSSWSLTDAQWAVLEPLLPPPGNAAGRGGRPEKYCRRLILDVILYVVRGGIAWRQLPGGVPARIDGVRDLRALGPRGGVAAHPRCVARPGTGPCRAGAVPERSGHRLADRARRRHRGAVSSRVGRRETDERGQAPRRGGCSGLQLAVVVTAASIQDRDAAHRLLGALRGTFSSIRLWSGPTVATPGGCWVGRKVYSPFGLRSSNGYPAAPDSTCGPEFGWWSARSAGSSSTVVAGVPTRPDSTTTRPSSTSP